MCKPQLSFLLKRFFWSIFLFLIFQRRPKEQFDVNIGDSLAHNVTETFAITPPAVRLIIRAGNGNHPDFNFASKNFLVKQARSSGVWTNRNHVQGFHGEVMILQPGLHRQRRAVSPVAARLLAGGRLNQIVWQAQSKVCRRRAFRWMASAFKGTGSRNIRR